MGGDRAVLGQCETDRSSGGPLDKLSTEAINFCRSLGSQASTVTEIVRQQDPLVYAAIQQGIDAVNLEAISEAQQIRKWAILEKDFSIQGGELGERAGGLTALASLPALGHVTSWVSEACGSASGLSPGHAARVASPFLPGRSGPLLSQQAQR